MKEKDRSPVRKRSRMPDDCKERRGSLPSRRTGELLAVASNNGNSYVSASSRRSLPGDKRDSYSDIRPGNGYDYGVPPAVLASRSDPRSSESEYNTLKISELGSHLNDEDIEDGLFHEFKKFGNVSVKMSRENGEKVAFVNFRKPEDARAAKHARGRLVLFDRPLKVDLVYNNRRRSRSPLSKDNFPTGQRHVPPQRTLSPTGLGYRDFRLQQMALSNLPPPPLPHLTDVERDAYYSLYDARNHAAFLPEFHNDNSSADDQRANRTLFLGNLDVSLTENDLRRAFDRFGTITEVDIKRAARGQNNFGFVKFENLDMAHRAKVAMSGKMLGRNPVKIGYGKPTPTTRLWVGGLGSWVSLSALAKEFDRFGTIRTIDYRKGESSAYVQYESLDAAQAACANMRGFPLGSSDRRLRVDFADTEQHYKQQQQYNQPPLALPHYDSITPAFDHRFTDPIRERSPLLPPRFRERELSSPAEWSGLGVHERTRGSGFPAHLERLSREPWTAEREWELQRGEGSRRRRHPEHAWRTDRSPDHNGTPRNGSPVNGGGDSDGERLPRSGRPSPTRGRPNSQDRRRRPLSPTAAPSNSQRERKRKPADKLKSPAGKDDVSGRTSAQKLSHVWQGVLLLKNSSFPTALHLLEGDMAVVSRLLQEGSKDVQASQLKISQRLRMEPPKLEEVSRRIKAAGPGGYSVLLAVPVKSDDAPPDGKDSMERPLKNLVSYLKQKEAAGIVSLPVGGARAKEHSGVLHAFPPCEFSMQFMDESAKAFAKSDDDYMVMVIIRGAS
ncbi:RNA-binding protein 15-like [Corythoichthys intestinalis]|uniref:RNA-binding protein 15-like n=1 Tax=Corythoichthys intestinalis TaxID=161448 RepID=UPI0025A5A7F1|nr:RNA-binding protein 15-like [Corythoichthys intestinalis]XP_057703126.1 RNA-binding protein 15-like [Corythoichthys intestinalis]XP_061814489.1 RNA-binding protein 15-like [Nerophis lumbriciformis]